MLKTILLILLIPIIGQQAFSSTSHYVGPFLNFIEAGESNDEWHLSALVVAPSTIDNHDLLSLKVGALPKTIKAELIATINNQNFWRYNLYFKRHEEVYRAKYSIGESGKEFKIFIPAKNTDPHVFFGTCNQLLEAPSTWSPINLAHSRNPYNLAILGGDQLYVDMLPAGKKGVFEVESVKTIMNGSNEERMKPLTEDQKHIVDEELTENLLGQYLEHYAKQGFAEFLATVPTKCTADDHEYFNGKGSYSKLYPVMERIVEVADYFYYLFQHHTTKERYYDSKLIGVFSGNPISPLISYSYLLKFKTMAFYGLDTRTERTLTQVSSPQSREMMFELLRNLTQKNIFVITGIPLVFQNLNFMDTTLDFINKHYFLKYLYNKAVGQPSVYNRLDISTDCSDYWYAPSHVEERNQIVKELDNLVKFRGSYITLLAGDPHSASAGEIIDQQTNEVRLRQITSSAITTPSAPEGFLKFKHFFSFFQKSEVFSESLIQRLVKFCNLDTGELVKELAFNNWLDLRPMGETVTATLWTMDKKGIIQNWQLQS